ncbi:MAG: hypothetical protein IPH81_12750 [Candidatus Microthrix sp.]|nr:hypothetical protein [Candidatus Microthrix sp.]
MEPARRVTSRAHPATQHGCGRRYQSGSGQDDSRTAPWHFWLMVAALTIYLGWRLVQGIMWAIGKL